MRIAPDIAMFASIHCVIVLAYSSSPDDDLPFGETEPLLLIDALLLIMKQHLMLLVRCYRGASYLIFNLPFVPPAIALNQTFLQFFYVLFKCVLSCSSFLYLFCFIVIGLSYYLFLPITYLLQL
jgi:hypothetical protein